MTRRLTFTFSRADVAQAVAREALGRGCDPQAVINDVLARHFIERAEERLAEQLSVAQGVLRHLTGQPPARPPLAAPPLGETPIPMPIPVAVTTASTQQQRKRNAWEQ